MLVTVPSFSTVVGLDRYISAHRALQAPSLDFSLLGPFVAGFVVVIKRVLNFGSASNIAGIIDQLWHLYLE